MDDTKDDDVLVDQVAEALYNEDSLTYGGFYISWKDASKHRKDNYWRLAKAAIAAMQKLIDDNED